MEEVYFSENCESGKREAPMKLENFLNTEIQHKFVVT